uniref:Beta-1,4-galactosyltransferase 7 n=1 Tax=Panagrellus redivivus TaxID=6233 RepID=A0A7E4V9W8_PANRE
MRLWQKYTVSIVVCLLLLLLYINLPLGQNEYEVYGDPLIEKNNILCILIPYRDRWEELLQLVPELNRFLNRQHVDHRFIVLNQTDSNRFNRASLINVGWFEADRLHCTYMVMHDVDLIPLNPDLDYRFPGEGVVRHIAAGAYHPKVRYDYPKFIGGILMLTMHDFKLVNGMSNKYWGWGLEDDEFYLRLRDANLLAALERPGNLTTGRSDTFKHVHDDKHRKRDQAYIGNQRNLSRTRDRKSGLVSVQYRIADRRLIKIEDTVVAILDVKLICDKKWTPYCTLKRN